MADKDKAEVVETPTESPFKRLRVGDLVAFEDTREGQWPPVHMEGTVESFANAEGSYLNVNFGEHGNHELTEDDVVRIGQLRCGLRKTNRSQYKSQ